MNKIIAILALASLSSAAFGLDTQQSAEVATTSDASNTGVNVTSNGHSNNFVFPAPVQPANLPPSNGCVLTSSATGAFGWNLLSGNSSDQIRAEICDLMDQVTVFTRSCQFLSAAIVQRNYLLKQKAVLAKQNIDMQVPDIPEGTKNFPMQECYIKKQEPKPVEIIQPPIENKPRIVEKVVHRESITLAGNVTFDSGKAQLTSGGKKLLDKFIDSHKNYKNVTITVVGHTDNVGSYSSNKELSENRAKSVLDYIASKMEISTRHYEGKSYDEPIADNRTESGKAMNRRVELSFVGTYD